MTCLFGLTSTMGLLSAGLVFWTFLLSLELAFLTSGEVIMLANGADGALLYSVVDLRAEIVTWFPISLLTGAGFVALL